MKFQGVVQFRSSVRPGAGPPGETEVLALNPERRERILAATGWSNLEPGSLNLTVDNFIVEGLLKLQPALVEDAATIRYPDPYKHIPQMRRAYHYYRAIVISGKEKTDSLVRRALVPVPNRVELFAPVNLRSTLGLSMGDQVLVEISESNYEPAPP